MSGISVSQTVKEATIEAVIIRADGRIENLGCVAYHSNSRWKRMKWRISQCFKAVAKRITA